MNRVSIGLMGVLLAVAAGAGGYWYGQWKVTSAPSGRNNAGPGFGGPGGAGKGGPGVGVLGAVAVEAIKVAAVPLPHSITAVGSLRSDESIIVRPEVAGRIAAIQFQEGQRIAKGATLIKLDPAVNEAEVRQARANLDLAHAKHMRSIELQQRGFISAQARDEAENNLKVAEAALALAQAKLAKTEIRAPFAGLIGLRLVSLGDYVKEGQDMVNLESIDPLKVDFRVPEIFMKEVKVGQPLQVALDALPDKVMEGRVFAVNPLVDAAGRSFVIRAVVRNPQTDLRPGMFARVRLITRDIRDALVVPEQALLPQGSDQFVFRVVDGKALRTKVEIGQRRDGRAEILSGVVAGDLVVTAGQLKIRDGVPVTISGGADAAGAPPQRPDLKSEEARRSASRS